MRDFDLAGQAGRRASFLGTVRGLARTYFRPTGEWCGTGPAPECREWLWLVFAALAGDAADVAFASELVTHAPAPGRPDYPFCVFANNHAAHLLAVHRAAFSAPARARLETWTRQALQEKAGSRQAALQFHGYNDNMPAKATLGMILGGESLGDAGAVEHGLWNLHQLRLLLARRGVISEHCSPTYTPLTLTNLAEIAAHAGSAEARTLAAGCAGRVWAEILAHYHHPTRSVAGPYSRAYSTDSVGHLSALNMLLWLVFGPEVMPDPIPELLRTPPRLVIHHSGDNFFVLTCFAFVAACHHEPPAALLDWARHRQFPFRFAALTERGEGGTLGAGPAAWPPGSLPIRSIQTANFAIGTDNGDWVNQAERWHLVYRRRTEVTDWADTRHLTLRYLVNDDLPGRIVASPRGDFRGEPEYLAEHGLHHTVQAGTISLVVSRPVIGLAGQPVSRMGLAILLPEHLNRVEHLEWDAGHVWLRDGPFQLAIRPLGLRQWSPAVPPVVFLESGAYRMIFFPNYAGEPRQFTGDELSATVGGFVAIPGWSEEIPAADFRRRVLAATLTDFIWDNQHTVQWHGFGRSLELSHGVLTNGVRYAAVDGVEVSVPVWEADGLPFAQLPLADSARPPNPKPFPFKADGYRWNEFPSALFSSPTAPASTREAPTTKLRLVQERHAGAISL